MATFVPTCDRRFISATVAIIFAAIFAAVIAALASGGRPDPHDLRAASTLLGGSWRFHVGDDLRWAELESDDHAWEVMDLNAPPDSHDGDVGLPDFFDGWSAHGHVGYAGYAWYRRAVDVPAGPTTWNILGPSAVNDAYELYWNGRLLGGSGRLGNHPRVVGTRPLMFALPLEAAGKRGVLALRAYMLPRAEPSSDAGGMRTAPVLAPRRVAEALHQAHWRRTIAGYIVDAVEPLAIF